MASKRKKQGPLQREKIIERQAFASMELALVEFHENQNTKQETMVPPNSAELSAMSQADETPPIPQEPTQASIQADIASQEGTISLHSSQVGHGLASREFKEIPGLPQKTAHDPTSHMAEDLVEPQTGESSHLFWVFLFVLVLIASWLWFKN